MNLLTHNLKVALRNLMKYKLQTLISVVSIAVGIVTLSFTHSVVQRYSLPSIYFEPYYDRAYRVSFKSMTEGNEVNIDKDVIRAIKGNGGLRNAEKIAVPNGWSTGIPVEFHLADSTVRKGNVGGGYIDPQYPDYVGLRSAITGEKIKVLKAGEGIISEDFAKKYFLGKNPIGAVQTLTIFDTQPIPITIVDVYKTPSAQGFNFIFNDYFYYCIADNIEDLELKYCFSGIWINVVLRENSTREQLLKEINERVKPMGLTAELSKVSDDTKVSMLITIQLLGYIIGSLILLAAIIGFLRIQTQLFRIRSRELSLRLVNGATRLKLFCLLLTEVAITICLAVIVALFLGGLLQDFCDNKLNLFIDGTQVKIKDLGLVSLEIGGALLVICSLIAWVILQRVVKSTDGLSANMRRSRNHLFRNTMLGIQIVISFIFVSSTFILVNAGDKILKACNVPDNDDFYRECLYLESVYATDRALLLDELKRLPELEKMIMCSKGFWAV
ncbi:MAG: FtsX-like permease family protein, partial [Muribaculaceae bacterium]|nr:FtsX-like permease family protein [Muribaculaceae bacterium]